MAKSACAMRSGSMKLKAMNAQMGGDASCWECCISGGSDWFGFLARAQQSRAESEGEHGKV